MFYNIQHIDLREINEFPPTKPQENVYYIIWWSHIPLGDFYLHIDEQKNSDVFTKKLIEAIKDTLQFYNIETEEKWIQFITNGQMSDFNRLMSDFLKANVTDKVSESLPVSVIICTRNRASHLNTCLQKLKSLKYVPQEIIVVDNAPIDDATKKVVQSFDNIQYIEEPRPGLDIARNTGIKTAKKPIVAFIDDDAEAHPYWIYRIWETFENNTVDAMTGLVFPSKLQTEAQVLFERYWSFNRGYRNKLYDENYINKNRLLGAPVWEIGAGVNMAFKREVFNKVGNFDVLLDAGAAGCNGDSEMWFRILVNGFKICYNPKAVVFHEHRADMPGLEKQIFNYMKGNTAAALIQQEYHPSSGYRTYIFNMMGKKIKSIAKRIAKGHWNSSKILRLEVKGVIAGLGYYYKTKR